MAIGRVFGMVTATAARHALLFAVIASVHASSMSATMAGPNLAVWRPMCLDVLLGTIRIVDPRQFSRPSSMDFG